MGGQVVNEIRRRIGLASGAFRKYYCLFKTDKLDINIKKRLYNAIIVSIVLYGFESWPDIHKHTRKISRMLTGQKAVINNKKYDGNEFKIKWDEEEKELLLLIKERKLKYLRNIFDEEEGCKKVKEFLEKDHKNNPFFEFI